MMMHIANYKESIAVFALIQCYCVLPQIDVWCGREKGKYILLSGNENESEREEAKYIENWAA